MVEEHLHRRCIEARQVFAVTLGVDPQEMHRQQWYIFPPVAQRRHPDLDRVQPKKQVFPEAAGADFRVQV
jgi:hypothetical protein